MDSTIFEELKRESVYKIRNFSAVNGRGRLAKCFEKDIYRASRIESLPHEIFTSVFSKNVIRGIYVQAHNSQEKIVSIIAGKAFGYIIDSRLKGKTLKKWICVEMNANSHMALYVPRGFGYGFWSMEDGTVVLYLCDGTYDKGTDTGVLSNDSKQKIAWSRIGNGLHSKRDWSLTSFQEYMKDSMRGNSGHSGKAMKRRIDAVSFSNEEDVA